MDVYSKIKEIVLEACKNESQRAFANKIGIDQAWLSSFLNGKYKNPGHDKLILLAQGCNLKDSYFIEMLRSSEDQQLGFKNDSQNAYEKLSPIKKRLIDEFDKLDPIQQEAELKRIKRLIEIQEDL